MSQPEITFLVISRTAAQYIQFTKDHSEKNKNLAKTFGYKRVTKVEDLYGYLGTGLRPVFLVMLDRTYWSDKKLKEATSYAIDHGMNIKWLDKTRI